MKRRIFLLAALVLLLQPLRADEGMWLPVLISQRIGDMQAKGFKLSAEDIYSVNQASLKDAVVLFGGGCTGEVVSDEGLLLTNHHCGYGYIQRHSSVEHDYLKDGFWAMDRKSELPNRGLTVSFLERMEDVTAEVLKGYDKGMTESMRDSVVRANSARLIQNAVEGGKGLRASVEALYYGNQYFLFVYKIYRDVRLVGAPPSSIGKFGCGPAIPEISPSSGFTPARIMSLPTILRTMFLSVPRSPSRFQGQEPSPEISPSFMAALEVLRNMLSRTT